eukprot:1629439-Pleurochrysis_carterae.AAC.3
MFIAGCIAIDDFERNLFYLCSCGCWGLSSREALFQLIRREAAGSGEEGFPVREVTAAQHIGSAFLKLGTGGAGVHDSGRLGLVGHMAAWQRGFAAARFLEVGSEGAQT